jgi:TonB family protein
MLRANIAAEGLGSTMSEYEQSVARWSPPASASDVLSDATDLGSLLSAILGDTSDGVSTLPPTGDDIAATDDEPRINAVAATDAAAQPDAVAVTDSDPEEAEYDAALPPAITQGRDGSSSSGGLDAFSSEEDIESGGVFQPSSFDDSETSAFANLAALSGQLQAVCDGESKVDRSNDILEAEPNLRVAIEDAGVNRQVESTLFIFEPNLYGRSADRRAEMSTGETDRMAGETNHFAEGSLIETGARRQRLATRILLILVGVGVVASSAFITLNALPPAFKAGEPPPAPTGGITAAALQAPSAAPSDTRDVAADPAPAAVSVTPSLPMAASVSERPRDVRATPPSSSESRRANARPARSAAPPGRKAVASNDDDAMVTPPETPSRSSAQTERSEPAPPGADTSVASAPVTTTANPVKPLAGATITGSLPVSEKPSAEPPAPSNAARSASATIARTAPRLIKGGAPEYAKVLRTAGIGGAVEVHVTIDETGRVTQAAAVTGPALLRAAAERAVRTWVYEPATVNGVRTSATTMVSFHFERK